MLADEEEKDGDSSDSKEHRTGAVRSSRRAGGSSLLLHGARAERRCLGNSVIDGGATSTIQKAEAALGTRTLWVSLREFAALSEIVEASLEANQDLRDTWGRLSRLEKRSGEKKGQLGT